MNSVALPNGMGYMVMNKCCKERGQEPSFTQLVSVFVVRHMGVFDCFDGCPDDVRMVSVGIC